MSYSVILKKVRIKNFRSIIDETIEFDRFNIFVGFNDSGKSNVLKALNLFFNGKTENTHEFNFDRDYSQKGITGQGKAKEIIIELDLLVPNNFSEKGVKTWKKVWRRDGLFSDNLKDLFKEYSKCVTLFNRIIFEYIPAVKSSDYFQDLLLKLYYSMIQSANNALATMNKSYSSTLKSLTIGLSDNIKKQLNILSTVQMPDELSILFRNMKISTKDNYVHNIDLDYRGDGIKARHIPSILLSITRNVKTNRQKNSIDYTYIWGYEEPENGVEFSACQKLAEELYGYNNEIQILLTTHSPAIYGMRDRVGATCYYTYKNDRGASKYESDYSVAELHNKIGLMPLIAPYIEERQRLLREMQEENNRIVSEFQAVKELSQKVVLYTEGQTDAMYIGKALEGTKYISRVLINPNLKDVDYGDSNLEQRYKLLQQVPGVKICIFDRDNTKYIISEEYCKGDNNTFKFSIPIPSFRQQGDLISIEHYFKDDEIMTFDENGRRLFMLQEFDKQGNTRDDVYFCQYPIRVGINTPLHILDGRDENSKVFKRKGTENVALSKKAFATNVITQKANFNFKLDEFKLIVNVIAKIIDLVDTK